MSISSVVILTVVCWWFSCASFVTSDYEKGLFPHDTIKDFKYGTMAKLFHYVHQHTITLVFFYTPWSGQCMKHIPQLLEAYKRISNSVVTIAAINCWTGRCREDFPTLHYPRLFLYHSHFNPIEYNDEIKADNIIRFLQLSISPWRYIGNSVHLEQFLENNDDYYVAYMDPVQMNQNPIYNVFYHSTLLLINKSNRPKIGVITNKTLAGVMQLRAHGDIRSKLLHPNVGYSTQFNYTPDAINQWMVKKSKRLVHVLKPHAPDTHYYLKQLKRGPALIFRSPLTNVENGLVEKYVNMALSYHDCDSKNSIKRAKKLCSSHFTSSRVCTFCRLCVNGYCSQGTLRIRKELVADGLPCSSGIFSYSNYKYSLCCARRQLGNMQFFMESGLFQNQEQDLKPLFFSLNFMQDFFFHHKENPLDPEYLEKKKRLNLFSTLNKFLYLDHEEKRKCNQTFSSSSSFPSSSIDNRHNKSFDSLVTGLGCYTNRTLRFYLLKNDRYDYILKHIGVNDEPGLLIVDLVKEEYYALKSTISSSSLASFILKFTFGRLEQNYFPQIHRSRLFEMPIASSSSSNQLKIVELTSLTFHDFLTSSKRNVFVMFYSLWCGMCKSVNLLFLKLVHSYDGDVSFARIDGDTNSLPWQYKANVYPSFIFFPVNGRDDSVNYPSDLPVTLDNLKQFLDEQIDE